MRDNLPVESYLNMMHTYYQRELEEKLHQGQITKQATDIFTSIFGVIPIRC